MINLTDRHDIADGELGSDGFWHTKARFARAGIQLYPKRELAGLPGIEDVAEPVRVLRPDDVVFDGAAMSSFEHKPITVEHRGGQLTTDNAVGYIHGVSKAPVSKDLQGRLTVPVVLYDKELIEDIKTGARKELSAGYAADFNVAPGVDSKYGDYDVVMTQMVGNHITVTRSGKAGPEFTIGDKKMSEKAETRDYQGVSIVFDSQGAEAFDAIVADRDKAVADLDAVKKERDEIQAKFDLAESTKVSDADLDKMIADRTEAIDEVRKVFPDVDIAGKSIADMKREAVAKTCDLDLEDKSDDYIQALFDAAIKSNATAVEDKAEDKKAKTKKVEDNSKSVAEIARERFIKEKSGRNV